MNRMVRFLMFFYSVILALLSMVLIYGAFDDSIFSKILAPMSFVATNDSDSYRLIYILFFVLLLASAVYSITYCILSGRLSKTRVRKTDIGTVDIGADAIESIALNSARSAQVGIKSAKVRVSSGKNDAIKVALSAVLYSNVEIPASMAKVQEKIKKDIERYTGIVVEAVSVKVSKVEPVVAKVDK